MTLHVLAMSGEEKKCLISGCRCLLLSLPVFLGSSMYGHIERSIVAQHGKEHIDYLELAVVGCFFWMHTSIYKPVVIRPDDWIVVAERTHYTVGKQ